jgi:hypothetical protein
VEADEELIRGVWERWNDGQRDPDAPSFDPEMEVRSALTGNVYTGLEGIRQWVSEIGDQFDSWQLEVDEVRTLEPGLYAVRGAILARGRNSGVDLNQPASWRVETRDGRILRIENFIGSDAWAEAGGEAA